MSERQYTRQLGSLVLLAAVALLHSAPVECQVPTGAETNKKADIALAPDVARWQYLLDDLAHEARTLIQEERRPLLLAEVADAYWNLDRARSRELFTSAFEAALSLKSDTGEAGRALRRVITLASRRDSALARGLTEKISAAGSEGSEKSWARAASVSAALDLLETDADAAAQLAEANSPAGPSLDSAWFILQLAKHNPAAADRVYGAYLSRFAHETGFGLERLLWLAGYPFGYAEAFGGSLNPTEMVGFSGMRAQGLTQRPALAGALLDVALRASQDALRRAGSAEPRRAEALNGLVLFTAAYLLPEVRRYRPQAWPAWSQVEQQAHAGTSAPVKDAVAKRVQEIFASRPRAGQQESGEPYAAVRVEDLLAEAEKLPGGCKRDRHFARAALSISHGQDFSRALEITGRVESEPMRESVRQFLYYDISYAAFKRGDAAGLEEAQKYAERVSAPEQRALLYIKIAKAVRRDDRQLASGLLGKTMRLTETVSEPATQASILLAAAAGFADFDAYDGYKALKEAVKIVNRARKLDVEDFRVLRKVNLACQTGEDTWYGDSDRAERFSLFETFASLSATDADGALALARDLDDPATRIRSLIYIARAMTKKAHAAPPRS